MKILRAGLYFTSGILFTFCMKNLWDHDLGALFFFAVCWLVSGAWAAAIDHSYKN